jgi:hypothetical protein
VSTEVLSKMTMTEDIVTVDADLQRYVKALDDRVSNYQRFFDGLLVKRPDHDALFHDLRCFREQDHITVLLTDDDSPERTLKDIYRETTRHFLASRFAHPWCRNEYGQAKHSFLHKSSTKLEARQKEEDRLHKLLVPIWVPFRRRMMPSPEEMSTFLEQEQQREVQRQEALLRRQAEDEALRKLEAESGLSDGEGKLVFRTKARSSRIPPSRPNTTYFNAEAFVSEEDDLIRTGSARPDGTPDQAASLFVGLAATSFLASNKRVRKYLLRKINK